MATSISPATSATSGIPAPNIGSSSSSNIINRPVSGMCGGISSPVVLTTYIIMAYTTKPAITTDPNQNKNSTIAVNKSAMSAATRC